MPIIIWGSRGITSHLDTGEFNCPHCEERQEYALKQNRPFFTLYFIPIFPVGGATRYVECRGCGNAYTEEVLNYEPPSEWDRVLADVHGQLRSGTSLETLKAKLQQLDLPAEKAEEILTQLCDGQAKGCVCGERYHPSVARCGRCGAEL